MPTSTPHPTLTEQLECDVCIIGAGYTGLSSALHLVEKGYKVVVLEAARVGFGASGRNGGQIVNSYSRDIDTIEGIARRNRPGCSAPCCLREARSSRRRIKRYNIQCDLRGGVFAAETEKQLHELKAQQARWEKWGNDQLELLDADGVRGGGERSRRRPAGQERRPYPPPQPGSGEAEAIRIQGADLRAVRRHQHHPVSPPWSRPPRGGEGALCRGGGQRLPRQPGAELAGKSMPCGTQVIATELLGRRGPARCCRKTTASRIATTCSTTTAPAPITGSSMAAAWSHHGARDPADIERLIIPKMLKTLPQLAGVKVEYTWTGNFLLTLSRLPQFGRIGPNIYYMQGWRPRRDLYPSGGQAALRGAERSGGALRCVREAPSLPLPGGVCSVSLHRRRRRLVHPGAIGWGV